MKDTIEFFLGTPCEIKTMNNDLLVFGRMDKVIDENTVSVVIVSLEREEALPMIAYGTMVKIVLRKGDEMMIIGGTVYICNEKFWRINSISQYQNYERRGFFRVSTAARGYVSPGSKEKALIVKEETYPARLVNISLSGVMFISEHDFNQVDLLYLHSLFLTDSTDTFSLICTIVAKEVSEDGKGIRYRCTFGDLDAKTSDQLCKAIFELQRESIKKMRSRI